ncbi:MAG: metallophosphatase [Paenibacillaceae bacterium]|jgi:hypothetical protein|nr:metallophosphatase [Paenibacillaceae bacterium]
MSKPFSIIIVPDTQIMAKSHPAHFTRMTRWIATHADELNLKMVLHLGDVVNNGAAEENQYRLAQDALNEIDQAGIPLMLVPGNHDYDNMVGSDRSLTLYNRYFGLHRYKGKPWFGGVYEPGQAENSYATLEVEGTKYLFLGLEFGPRDEVLEWADSILRKHSDHLAIVFTHCYMYTDGGRNTLESKHNPKIYKGAHGANDGEDLWNKLISKHANIIGVYSGHQIPKNLSYRVDWGDHGNMVFQSFQNWQSAFEGGEGRFRVLTIDPDAKQIHLRVFHPGKEEYEDKPGSELTIPLGTPEDRTNIWFHEDM